MRRGRQLVEATESLDRCGNHARGIRLFAHVGLRPDGLAPVFVDRRQDAVQAFTFARDDYD